MLAAVLAVVKLLRVPIRALGVDYPVFREVLQAKLRSDMRPRRDSGSASFMSKGLLLTAGVNLMVGGLLATFGFLEPSAFAYMAVVQAAVMFLVFFTLVVDFTQVLFGGEDLGVLGHHPISNRTLFAAQVGHAVVYLTLVAGAIALVPTIVAGFIFPFWIGPPAMLLATILSACLAVFGVVVVYGVAMRLVGPERFRSVLLYSQIALISFGLGAYQVLNLHRDWAVAMWEFVTQHPWSMCLIPPCWFGGLFQVLLGEMSSQAVLLAALAVFVPILTLLFGLKLNSSGFIASLNPANALVSQQLNHKGKSLSFRIGRVVTRPGVEHAGYEFARALMKGENLYRKQCWPSLLALWVLALAIQFGGMFDQEGSPSEPMLVFSCYFLLVAALHFVSQLRFSENWTASGMTQN